MSKVKVLITGGAGYIGSVLTRVLLERGFAVTVLDNFLFRQTSLLDCCHFPDFEVVRGDARDEAILARQLAGADYIFPLAALVGARICDGDQVAARTTNLGAVQSVLKLASRQQRIVLPNTNSGYGVGEKGKFCTEESPLRPISLYGRTKVEAEKAVLDRGNSVALRLATVFGASPRMRMDLLVNDFVHRALGDRAVVVFEGHFKRNYIHVRDVAKAFVHAVDHFDAMKERPYNCGLEDANLSKLELCQLIRELIPGFTFLEAPIGEDPDQRDYIVSNQRILATGWRPDWTIERGVRELIKVYTVIKNTTYANY